MPSLRTLPSAVWVALGAGVLAGLLVYAVPYATQSSQPVNATTGPRPQLTVEDGANETLAWTTQLRVDEPTNHRYEVRLPYHIEADPRQANSSRIERTVTVNGHTVDDHVQLPSPGELVRGGPGHLASEAFEPGNNTVEGRLTAQDRPDQRADTRLEAGPMQVLAYPRDGDGDGIVDPQQPIGAVSTVGLAALAGLSTAAVSGLLAHRRGGQP